MPAPAAVPAPIPTPLPDTAQAMDLQGGAATVTIEAASVAHAKSFISKSTGNEVATSTGGGVITHVVQGKAYFQTFSMDVFIESQPGVRHMDLVTHNHMAMMPGNTPPAPWMSAMLAGPGPAPRGPESKKRARERTSSRWHSRTRMEYLFRTYESTSSIPKEPRALGLWRWQG